MTQPEHEGPERRYNPGQFITMDAAMLAAQNQRLTELNENIVKLATAMSQRPTRLELLTQRRHDMIRNIAGLLFLAFVLGGFWFQQEQLQDVVDNDRIQIFNACEERNSENARFLKLLNDLSDGAPPESRSGNLLRQYAENLTPVDCRALLQKS